MITKEAEITISDEVHAQVILSDMIDVRQLVTQYSLPVKGHFFNPRYKIGVWDGRVQFYTPAGKTYVALLDDIIPSLVSNGYDISLVDNRIQGFDGFEPVKADHFSHILYPDTGEPIVLADHQLRVINGLLADTNGVAEACTGSGKTLITAAMCDRFQQAGLRTMVIVPSLDLIENTRDEITMAGIKDVGVLSGLEKDLDHSVVISTWQSLKNIPFIMKEFTCVLVDETHGARGQELKNILIEYSQHITFRYGMTGTLPDDPCDAMNVRIALGPCRAVVTAKELIDIGWLASLDIEGVEMEEDLRSEFNKFKQSRGITPTTYHTFKQKYFPDYASEKAYLSKNKARTQWIANYVDALRESQGNTFVLVTSIDQGKKLAELCPNSVFVHGTDKVKVRKQIYSLFKDADDVLVFATVNIASTGINIKRIFNLVLLDLGKSFIRTIQSIGRGLRRGIGKTHLKVYDISSDLKYSGKHRKDRAKYYKAKEYPYSLTKVDYSNT